LSTYNINQYLKQEEDKIWQTLSSVYDPEVPVLSVLDLGIIRAVEVQLTDNNNIKANSTITPTYTGCPAMDMISMNIRMALMESGIKEIVIQTILSPAWTTDWMTEAGKKKLTEYGIAPPNPKMTIPHDGIPCPRCQSVNTKLLSEFGSTACKSLYQCQDCMEPFDYFKCL
jgi:ring-1,2-phenylacetyl-CoA epoxidase subunit PaaD